MWLTIYPDPCQDLDLDLDLGIVLSLFQLLPQVRGWWRPHRHRFRSPLSLLQWTASSRSEMLSCFNLDPDPDLDLT